jgi:hypothetical protein
VPVGLGMAGRACSDGLQANCCHGIKSHFRGISAVTNDSSAKGPSF